MSDELRKRFEDSLDEDGAETDTTDDTADTDTTPDTSDTENTSNTGSTRGPDKDPDSTRNQTQVPMYLDEQRAESLNDLYDRLDAKSKLAGDGGIEKHADFMAAMVDLALDSEANLADRLDIPNDP
jgi:hypothetical protein